MPIAKAGYTNLQMSTSTFIFVQGLWSGARKPALAIGQALVAMLRQKFLVQKSNTTFSKKINIFVKT